MKKQAKVKVKPVSLEEEISTEDELSQEEERRQESICETGSIITSGGGHTIHCLTIIGQIEGHTVLPSQTKTTKYEHVIPQLAAIEEDSRIEGLLILLNTVGGDVEAGLGTG